MRDPKRILSIINKLNMVWNEHPDYRFGQLLINLGIVADDFKTWVVDDDITEQRLDEWINQQRMNAKKKDLKSS
jgi:hypothetical protein